MKLEDPVTVKTIYSLQFLKNNGNCEDFGFNIINAINHSLFQIESLNIWTSKTITVIMMRSEKNIACKRAFYTLFKVTTSLSVARHAASPRFIKKNPLFSLILRIKVKDVCSQWLTRPNGSCVSHIIVINDYDRYSSLPASPSRHPRRMVFTPSTLNFCGNY